MTSETPTHERDRLKALESLEILDTPPEEGFDDITALAALLCEAPIALISLVDESRQWFKSNCGLDATETSREIAFCDYAIREPNELLMVPDATKDPRFEDNPLVTAESGIRMYAGAPLVLPSGEAVGTLCVVDHVARELDETQREALRVLANQVVAQLLLRKRVHTLESSNTALSEYAHLVAHDLKGPLNGIYSYAGFLLEDYGDKLDADGLEMLEALPSQCGVLSQLLDSLLHYSSAEKIALSVSSVQLDDVVDSVLASLESLMAVENVTVVRSALPAANCDFIRLGEVIRNLVTNALKYNANAKKVIEIGAGPSAHDSVSFFVRDNGIGIAPENQEEAFVMLRQLNAEGTFGEGTGSGLAISRSLIERQGGEITLESSLGSGSTFRITLPSAAVMQTG